MKNNNFFASAAGKLLALAALLAMAFTFTACSDDDEPTPPEAPFVGTVTIDGVKMPVKSCFYDYFEDYFVLYLYLSDDQKKVLKIDGSFMKHVGKDVNLTVYEPKINGTWTWLISVEEAKQHLFVGCGYESEELSLFTTGKLRIDGKIDGGSVNIKLTDGKITDGKHGDGKEHTVNLEFTGKMFPKYKTIMLDGILKSVVSAEYTLEKNNDFQCSFYLSQDKKERIIVRGSLDGSKEEWSWKLDRKQQAQTGHRYWSIEYYQGDVSLFKLDGDPANGITETVASEGSLTMRGKTLGELVFLVDFVVTDHKTGDGRRHEGLIMYSPYTID